MKVSERSFEEAIECALLESGPDGRAGGHDRSRGARQAGRRSY